MREIILIRHGTTEANIKGCYSGQGESVLSVKGVDEARRLCQKLDTIRIDKIYASPSKRVSDTLSYLTTPCITTYVKELKEINFGMYEGKDFTWVKTHYPEEVAKMLSEGDLYQYPEGESLVMMHARVAGWLQRFLVENAEGTFVIAAHGGTLRCLLSELFVQGPQLHWHFKIETAAITRIVFDGAYPILTTLNEKN